MSIPVNALKDDELCTMPRLIRAPRPRLKELADSGKTVIEAVKVMGMEAKRTRLISRENNIKLPGPP
ncbi:hypothetical protein ACPCYX_22665 [Pseudomonas fluorescens]|uniref:hypothetical protein n=1 Tax=Pseudomonas fluorescens TaxID=294 RepID=UPI003C2A6FBC